MTKDDVGFWYSAYAPLDGDDPGRPIYVAAHQLSLAILDRCPAGADRDTALRRVQEVIVGYRVALDRDEERRLTIRRVGLN